MLLVNVETIPGREAEILGLVKGCTVHSKNIGRDLMAGLKTIVGGELAGYTEMIEEAREQAEERMINQAAKMGADAIVSVRYTSSSIVQGASEILAYGTAVRFK